MGYNVFGQLGDGTATDRLEPTPVPNLNDAKAISASNNHSCAIRDSGQAVCWGWNANGQLGDGSTTDRATPTSVTGLTDAKAIAAGSGHTCAIRTSGQVVCWGGNSNGQLGDGTNADELTAVPVTGLTDATSITAGLSHTCAIRTSGQAVCCGDNEDGELGDGTSTNRFTPTPVQGLADATSIAAASNFHSCAIRESGRTVCWGHNVFGQLGDGTNTYRFIPTTIYEAVPPPVSGKSVNLKPVSGVVTTKCRSDRKFQRLDGRTQVKVGCKIDTSRGTVSLTSAKSRKGTQTGRFTGGIFRVSQQKGRPDTTLALTGPTRCRRAGRSIFETGTLAGARVSSLSGRRLWGKSKKGRFTTKGKRGAASIRGTE
ncbi:MAG: RCC1 domain-containing protein [Solirubrobacterales bacterium]